MFPSWKLYIARSRGVEFLRTGGEEGERERTVMDSDGPTPIIKGFLIQDFEIHKSQAK
jgi:hypothetical protein